MTANRAVNTDAHRRRCAPWWSPLPWFVRPLSSFGASHTSSLNRSLAVKPFTTVAVVFLALIAAVHLLRLFAGWEVTVVGFVSLVERIRSSHSRWASVNGLARGTHVT